MSKEATSDIGLIGLAVMGQHLVLDRVDHGDAVSVYNRTTTKMTDFFDRVQRDDCGAHS